MCKAQASLFGKWMDPSVLKNMAGTDYELVHHEKNRLFVIDFIRRTEAVGRDGRKLTVMAPTCELRCARHCEIGIVRWSLNDVELGVL